MINNIICIIRHSLDKPLCPVCKGSYEYKVIFNKCDYWIYCHPQDKKEYRCVAVGRILFSGSYTHSDGLKRRLHNRIAKNNKSILKISYE